MRETFRVEGLYCRCSLFDYQLDRHCSKTICRGYEGYCAALHTLPQVYGGMWAGEHCLSCIAGGVNCSNYYAWLTNFVQNREGNCAAFCEC